MLALRWRAGLGHDVVLIDRSVPVLIHDRLGALYLHGGDELIGSINVDPEVRPARMNGDQDVEILLSIGGEDEGVALVARVERCAAKVDEASIILPLIKKFALEHLPAQWLEHYSLQPGPPVFERLFLEGLETDEHDTMRVVFDFGDLDQLIVELESDGRGRRVFLRP
jgi:hypothetical protein